MNVTDLYQHDRHGEAIQILFFTKINRRAECFYYNEPMHNYISQKYFFIYNIYSNLFQHFFVIIRQFYICALLSYVNS